MNVVQILGWPRRDNTAGTETALPQDDNTRYIPIERCEAVPKGKNLQGQKQWLRPWERIKP